jgi:hypothetical protein
VKRSAFPQKLQDKIFVVENVYPVHHDCHMEHGQKREMALRCLLLGTKTVGAYRIAEWYRGLIEYGVSPGLFPDRRTVPMATCLTYLTVGAQLLGRTLADDGWEIDGGKAGVWDYRGLCIMKWQKRKARKLPDTWNGHSNISMFTYLDTAYYVDYMAGLCGFTLGEVFDRSRQLYGEANG